MDKLDQTIVFIQARHSSVRYPGKVLEKLACGKTVLESVYSRVIQAIDSDKVFFIIPNESKLIDFLEEKSFQYIIGDLNNVRKRFIDAAKSLNPRSILRLTGDNPFVDIDHLHYLEEADLYSHTFLKENRYDCISFAGLPIGMGGEIFPYSSLISEKHGKNRIEFDEHVSLHLKYFPEIYKVKKLNPLLSRSFHSDENYRLTFDEPSDLKYLLKIQEYFLKINLPDFSAQDLLNHKEFLNQIPKWNSKVIQVAFELPKQNEETKGSISIIYGNPEKLGSGHRERTLYLNLSLQIGGHIVEWIDSNQNPTFDKVIIDSRDVDPNLYNKNDYLAIDNLNQNVDPSKSLHILPNLGTTFWSDPKIIIPYSIRKSKPNQKEHILIYTGLLEQSSVEILFDSLKKYICENDEIILVGNKFPKNLNISFKYYPRMSRFSYKRAVRDSKCVVSYFGQTLLEAMFFQKKMILYSFSKIHHDLALDFCEKIPSDYLGNLLDPTFPNPIINKEKNILIESSNLGDAIEYVYKKYE